MPLSPVLERVVDLSIGAGAGAFAAWVGLRTRLALMDRNFTDHDKQLLEHAAQLEAADKRFDAKIARLERLQLHSLRIVAHIARAVHVDARIDDQLVRFIAEAPVGDARRPDLSDLGDVNEPG